MKESDIKVSVIMPVYNSKKHLPNAIKMIQEQTVSNWELILINDASIDQSEEVINEYRKNESRIIYLKNDNNRGPSYSRNKGIKIANGKWIAIVDSDDTITKDRFEKLIEIGDQHQVDIIGDNQKWFTDEDQSNVGKLIPLSDFNKPVFNINLFDYIKSISRIRPKYTFGMIKPMIRSNFIKNHNIYYNERIRFGEDALYYFELLVRGAKFAVCNETFYSYKRDQLKNKNLVKWKIKSQNQYTLTNNLLSSAVKFKKLIILPIIFWRYFAITLRAVISFAALIIRN